MGSRRTEKLGKPIQPAQAVVHRRRATSRGFLVLLFLLCVFLDQSSKYLVLSLIGHHSNLIIIPNILTLKPVENPGFVFGLHLSCPAIVPLIGAIALTSLIFGITLHSRKTIGPGLILVLSGATGNLVDRLARAAVVDFISVPYWPVFNIADVLIVIGALEWAIELYSRHQMR